MKRKHYITALLLPFCMAFPGSMIYENNHIRVTKIDQLTDFPENVKEIIHNKCYVCHNPESKNITAKGKLDWDNLAELKDSKLARKLEDIMEVLNDGSMPPPRYLKMNPDAQLAVEEIKLLKEWIETTIKDISK